LAEQAKILMDEAEANNLGPKVMTERWIRWSECSLCEQRYHGLVACALGWACWKTYVGRSEADQVRINAMTQLGSGLHDAGRYEDALAVRETEVSMKRRLGAPEESILATQGNLANSYEMLGRDEEALGIRQDVYSGRLRLNGEEHVETLRAANNYARSLFDLQRFEEARSLLRKMMPVARRVLGEGNVITLTMRWNYARALYEDPAATLDDLREAVTALEVLKRTARRVLGGANPTAVGIDKSLEISRAALIARETPSASA
jgi:tetratricopeptide (TPR) repeat protein